MKKLVAAISCALFFACCSSVLLLVVFFQQRTIRDQKQEIVSLKNSPSKPRVTVTTSAQNAEGQLRNAVKSGDLNQLRLILDEHPEFVNAPVAGLGGTPLHSAAYNKQIEVVRELLKRGANLNVQDQRGTTPLHNAIHAQDADIILLLLKTHPDLSIKDANGQTALQVAKSKNRTQLIELLEQHGAKE